MKVSLRLGCNVCASEDYAAIVECPKCGAKANLQNKAQSNYIIVYFVMGFLLLAGLGLIMFLDSY